MHVTHLGHADDHEAPVHVAAVYRHKHPLQGKNIHPHLPKPSTDVVVVVAVHELVRGADLHHTQLREELGDQREDWGAIPRTALVDQAHVDVDELATKHIHKRGVCWT